MNRFLLISHHCLSGVGGGVGISLITRDLFPHRWEIETTIFGKLLKNTSGSVVRGNENLIKRLLLVYSKDSCFTAATRSRNGRTGVSFKQTSALLSLISRPFFLWRRRRQSQGKRTHVVY